MPFERDTVPLSAAFNVYLMELGKSLTSSVLCLTSRLGCGLASSAGSQLTDDLWVELDSHYIHSQNIKGVTDSFLIQ